MTPYLLFEYVLWAGLVLLALLLITYAVLSLMAWAKGEEVDG